jgi:hypothetical protein
MPSARHEHINLDELRARIRKLTDRELRQFGEAARSKCRDKSPSKVFIIQLEEATAEWRRRHPPKKKRGSAVTLPKRLCESDVSSPNRKGL